MVNRAAFEGRADRSMVCEDDEVSSFNFFNEVADALLDGVDLPPVGGPFGLVWLQVPGEVAQGLPDPPHKLFQQTSDAEFAGIDCKGQGSARVWV